MSKCPKKVYVYAAGHEMESVTGDSLEVARPTSHTLNMIRMQRSTKTPNALCRFAYMPSSFHEEDDDAQSVLGHEDANDMEMVSLPFGTSITPDLHGEQHGMSFVE